MVFELRKLLGGLAMPLSVVLILLIIGLLLLWFAREGRGPRAGRLLVTVATVLLFVVSSPWFSERWISPLESMYPPVQEPMVEASWVVVLGAGHAYREDWSWNTRLSDASLARLAEGVRLYRALADDGDADVRLWVSGYGRTTTTAEAMAETALGWGVPDEAIHRSETPRSTAEEAAAVAAELGDDEADGLYLVTSASHLPRAMELFRAQGLQPTPAPTHFQVNPERGERHIGHQLPQAGYLRQSERAAWEYLGQMWARLRGTADAEASAAGTDVAFEVVEEGGFCGAPEAGVGWIDHDRGRLLKISLGERTRGGYGIEVYSITHSAGGAHLEVAAREHAPDPDRPGTAVMTQPCAIVELAGVDGEPEARLTLKEAGD